MFFFQTNIPLLPAFAQVFPRSGRWKEPTGVSESKQQLINCWAWIRSCGVSSDPCKSAHKLLFSQPFVAHSPASSGQSWSLMGLFNCCLTEGRAKVIPECAFYSNGLIHKFGTDQIMEAFTALKSSLTSWKWIIPTYSTDATFWQVKSSYSMFGHTGGTSLWVTLHLRYFPSTLHHRNRCR